VSSGCDESFEDALKKKSGVCVLDWSKSSFGVVLFMLYMVDHEVDVIEQTRSGIGGFVAIR